jgi:hypothetical protein
MASGKRKRNSSSATPKKRIEYVDSSSASQATPENPMYYEAESILDERGQKGARLYHVKWKVTDPETGQDWTST